MLLLDLNLALGALALSSRLPLSLSFCKVSFFGILLCALYDTTWWLQFKGFLLFRRFAFILAHVGMWLV